MGKSNGAFEKRLLKQVVIPMSESEKEMFAQFAYSKGKGRDDIRSRLDTNAGPDFTNNDIRLVYRHLNFLNHSCRHNTRIVNRGWGCGERWEFRSLTPIFEKGTEVTIDCDECPFGVLVEDVETSELLLQSVKMKRRGVRERYGFDCCCEAYEEGEKTTRERKGIRALKMRLVDRPTTKNGELVKEMKRDMDRVVVKLEEHRLLNLARYAHEGAIEVCLAAGTEVEKAKEHVLKLIKVRRKLFG